MILKLLFKDKEYSRGSANIEVSKINVSGVYDKINKLMKSHYASQCDVYLIEIGKQEKLFTIG